MTKETYCSGKSMPILCGCSVRALARNKMLDILFYMHMNSYARSRITFYNPNEMSNNVIYSRADDHISQTHANLTITTQQQEKEI